MSDTVAAYVAGALDADGSVGIYRFKGNKYLSPKVYIAGQDLKLMQFLVDNYGGAYGWSPHVDTSGLVYMWRPAPMLPFLVAIEPHLITKKENVQLLIQWLTREDRSPSEVVRKYYIEESQRLNSRVRGEFDATESKSGE